MAYEKMFDLLELAILMQSNREGVSLKDIMNRFNVSRRTSERMRDMIVNQFPQTQEILEENNEKRWYIPQGTLKDFISFSADDIACLEVAKKALLKNKMTDKAKHLDSILNKITANIKQDIYNKISPDAEVLLEAQGFALRPGPKIVVDKEIITKLREALLSCHQIKLKYQYDERIKEFILNPYGFLYGDRNHYLLATHSDGYDNNNVHQFILNNIKDIEISTQSYQIDPNFNLEEYANRSFGVYQEEPFEVEWLFNASVADEAERMLFHPTQTTKRNKDGSLTVCFKAGGRLEMDWHLYTWGDKVKVIKPE